MGTSACGWSTASSEKVTRPPLRSATTVVSPAADPSPRRATSPRSICPDPRTKRSSSQRRGRQVVAIQRRTRGSTAPSRITPSSVSSRVSRSSTAARSAWSVYGGVMASTQGKFPAPVASAANQACSAVSSTALAGTED